MKYVVFEGNRFPISEDLTLEEAQDLLADITPAIAQSEGAVDESGNYVFTKKAGTKGN
jgi:hypothetical protein